MRKTIIGISALAAMQLPVGASAETVHEGWYGGLDLGMAVPNDMDTEFSSTDLPTNCDRNFPVVTVNGETLPWPKDDPRCTPAGGVLDNSFDLDEGPLLGVNVGYAWRGFRLEAEYFYRQHGGDRRGNTINVQGKDHEFALISESVADMKGHQFFGNVYYDFPSALHKLIPYVGGGMGFMLAEMDYSLDAHRNPDREALAALGRHPDASGTLSRGDANLTDTLWGYQLMAGLDYPLTESVFLGVKGRYVDFLNDFKDGEPFGLLRSHASANSPGGETVRYWVETDDWGFWGVSLNLKYFF